MSGNQPGERLAGGLAGIAGGDPFTEAAAVSKSMPWPVDPWAEKVGIAMMAGVPLAW